MALVDEIKLHIKAGKGGDGRVAWRHEKYIELGGPAGGDGGNGGNVYAIGTSDLMYLVQYKHLTELHAENGEKGGQAKRTGANGKDLFIKTPVGSVITDLATRNTYEILKDEEKTLILSGGKGGHGNNFFKSSTNRSPKQFEKGIMGEETDITIELRLIADVGLIGLPNAGKSSLLNELTAAGARVGAYPFTTLEPNLGSMGGIILADIPGLIDGAAGGKGLGIKFLRHISRSKILLHCIALDNYEDSDIMTNYRAIRKELEGFSKELAEKDELVILTKTDTINEKQLAKAMKEVRMTKTEVLQCSIYDMASIEKLGEKIRKTLVANNKSKVQITNAK